MSEDLKSTTAKSLIWNAIDKVGVQVIALVVGIITARLLSRDDFGYIAALALFTMLSNVLVESGFLSAMVRRKENTREEYSGAFIFNLLLSCVLYGGLYFSAPSIADYFNMPVLEDLARVLFFAIVVNSFGIVPNIILTKEFKFKYLSIANITSVVLSGAVAIYMAMSGYAYWAIAGQQISQVMFRVVLVWIFSGWLPTMKADFKVVRELLNFSFSLIFSNIMNTCVRYVYNFIIGPQYSAAQLGSYGQAYKFQNIASTVIYTTLTGVSYPVLSKLNDDKGRQLLYFRKLMRICAFLTFPAMFGLYAIAPNFISVVLTEKWMPMLPYFKILLLAGTFLPFMYMCTNTMIALGYPKINFWLHLLRNVFIIGLLFVLNDTIEEMLWGFLVANGIGYLVSVLIIGKYMKYSFWEHLKDIMPYGVLSFVMLVGLVLLDEYTDWNMYVILCGQIVLGGVFYLGGGVLLGSQIIKDIKQIIFKK